MKSEKISNFLSSIWFWDIDGLIDSFKNEKEINELFYFTLFLAATYYTGHILKLNTLPSILEITFDFISIPYFYYIHKKIRGNRFILQIIALSFVVTIRLLIPLIATVALAHLLFGSTIVEALEDWIDLTFSLLAIVYLRRCILRTKKTEERIGRG